MLRGEIVTIVAALSLASAASNASIPISSGQPVPDAGVTQACSELLGLFGDLVLYPDSTNYTAETKEYWDVRADLHPACIVLPSTADDVAKSMTILHANNAEFAIRGGGHMNYPGSNNIDAGVLLALTNLNHIQVSPNTSTVAVGPGNRWSDVYDALDPYDLYAIGGRLKTIGVPGLALIGGVHYFINKYGYTMDNTLQYSVVLGNGTQVVANKHSHPDLFWALKGGANNFGVVTEFVFQAYHIPQISTTIQVFNESAVRPFIEAACGLALEEDASVGAGSVITITYNATTKSVAPSLLGVQEGTESPPGRFGAFSEIPAVQRGFNVTRPRVWHAQLDTPNQMFRVQFGQHAIKPDPEQLFTLYEMWKDAVDEISDVEGLYPTFVLNTAPASAARVAKTNGIGNVWGLDDKQSMIWWQISTGWALAQDDLRMTSWARTLIDRFHALNKAKGLASEFIYMGDAGDYQNPFLGFPPENVERMRSIRAEYDPDRVFTRLNWGGFKLGA